MTKFITCDWDNKIKEIEVSRETDKCYFVRHAAHLPEDRSLKSKNYHETWDTAYAYLVKRATEKVEQFRYSLKRAESELASIQAMKR